MEARKILSRFVTTSIVLVVTVMFLISLTNVADATESVDFGNVTLGSSVTKSLRITNTDNQNILVFSLSFKEGSCDFSLNSNSLNIPPGETISLEIHYSPSNTDTCSDLLFINWGPLPWKEISVTGTGVAEGEPPPGFGAAKGGAKGKGAKGKGAKGKGAKKGK